MNSFRHVFFSTLSAAALIIGACGTAPKETVRAPTLQELTGKKDLTDQERDKIVAAALDRATKELHDGNPRAAIHFGKIGTEFDPEDVPTKLLMGKSYIALGDYHNALKVLNSISNKKLNAEASELRGMSYFFIDDFEKAEIDLKHSVDKDPARWQGAAVLGRLAYRAGENEQAGTWFDHALEHSENKKTVYNHMGYAYYDASEWDAAASAFEKVFTPPNPDNPPHLAYRVSNAKSGNLAEALNLASDTEIAEVYRELGRISLEAGNRVEAVDYLRRAKATSPKYDTETERLLNLAKAMKS